MAELVIEGQISKRKAELFSYLWKTSVAEYLILYDRTELMNSNNYFRLLYEGIDCANMLMKLKKSFDYVLSVQKNDTCKYRLFPCKAEENWQFYVEASFSDEESDEVYYVYFNEQKNADGIEEEELTLVVGKEKEVYSIRCYSVERKLVECFCYFIEYEDFAIDMEMLDKARQILKEFPISGRKMEETFQNYLKQRNISFGKKEMECFCALKRSTHLKKRWNFYWKRKKEAEPDFNQTISMMADFFSRLTEAIERDEILVEDWMPQIGRFL